MDFQKPNLETILTRERKNVFGFFIQKYRVTYLILAGIVLLGTYVLFVIPREADPEVKIPFALVTTVYPGATPRDVEELITDPIEKRVKNEEHLRRYTSSSTQGVSSIFVEYEAEADLDDAIRKLKDAVDEVTGELPDDAGDPLVTEIRANDFPIVTYSIVGDYSDSELKRFGEQIQRALEGISGVSKAPLLGGVEREFQIIAQQERLDAYGISLGHIIATVQRGNIDLPLGNIEIDGFEYTTRVKGKYTDAESLNGLVVATINRAPVYVRDVARIVDTFKEKRTQSRIGFAGDEAMNTISIQVYKKTGGNILNIVDESHRVIEELQSRGALAPDIHIEKTNDNAVFIRDDLRKLGVSGIQTIILIFVLLAIVIGFREAIITGLSVPIAFLMAFIALFAQDMTLNSIVLFSLVLSLGLMVDNSIVIIEGINEYIEKHGKAPRDAALLSIWNYRWPIVSGTLTTVSAFVPMLLVSGIVGEYLSYLPKTITWTLLSSLFVALIIIPTLVSRALKPNGANARRITHGFVHRMLEERKGYYARLLQSILPHKKKRRIALAAAWGLFLISMALPVSGIMNIEMFPRVDLDYFVINVELPAGSALVKTDAVAAAIERELQTIPELDNYVTNLGTSASIGLTNTFDQSAASQSNRASITVNLKDKSERKRKSFEIVEDIRPRVESISGGTITVQEISAGPPTGAPIEARVTGSDSVELSAVAEKLVTILDNIEGVINIQDSIDESTGEFSFVVDRESASYYGLTIADIAHTLRTAHFGATASHVSLNGEDIDITVRYADEAFVRIDDLEEVTVQTAYGDRIPVKQVAEVSIEPSLSAINHRDGKKVVTVSAEIEEGVDLQDVLGAFESSYQAIPLSPDTVIEVGGEVEDIEQSFTEMFYSMIVAVLLILIILVLQFNSFKQPLIILFTLPLAVIGVIFGLMLLRQPFGFPAFIGIVALAGIVVNDAIVLIDRINKNIASGMEYTEAIIDGGTARMQPILLTSVTTIAGILPLAFADEFWRGLSITVIFGLLFGTMLTLVIVPIMFHGVSAKTHDRAAQPDV